MEGAAHTFAWTPDGASGDIGRLMSVVVVGVVAGGADLAVVVDVAVVALEGGLVLCGVVEREGQGREFGGEEGSSKPPSNWGVFSCR